MTTVVIKPDELISLEVQQQELLEQIALTTVENEEQRVQSADWLARVRGLLKMAETVRKAIVGPKNDEIKGINAAFAAGLRPAKEAEIVLDRNISGFYKLLQEAQRREQARLDRLAERRADRAEERGEVSAIPEVIPAIATAPEKTTVTEAGKVGMRAIPKWKWANESQRFKATSKLPDEFWTPDEVGIGKLVRAGIPQLAFGGAIIIYEKYGTTVRR